MNTVAERITYLRQMHNRTQAEFAEAVEKQRRSMPDGGTDTVSRGAVGNWESGKGISRSNMQAIAEAFGISFDWLVTGRGTPPTPQTIPPALPELRGEARRASVGLPEMNRDLPVLGTAAAAAIGQGAFQLTSDVIEYVARPPGLAGAKGVYALYVEGDSMLPRFSPGELIFVHPGRPISAGDVVVVQEPDSENGEPRAFIKILISKGGASIRTRQLNPPLEISFRHRDGVTVHKVMSTNELFGL